METLPLSDAKARLDELVDEAQKTREPLTITRNGRPVAVIVSADEWESLQETLYWRSRLTKDEVARALAESESGEVVDAAELRRLLGVERAGSNRRLGALGGSDPAAQAAPRRH